MINISKIELELTIFNFEYMHVIDIIDQLDKHFKL